MPDDVLAVAIVDLATDGKNEILFSTGGNLDQLNAADGGAQGMLGLAVPRILKLLMGDFNRDGAQDIVAEDDRGIELYLNGYP